jgi:hypothetical protein
MQSEFLEGVRAIIRSAEPYVAAAYAPVFPRAQPSYSVKKHCRQLTMQRAGPRSAH